MQFLGENFCGVDRSLVIRRAAIGRHVTLRAEYSSNLLRAEKRQSHVAHCPPSSTTATCRVYLSTPLFTERLSEEFRRSNRNIAKAWSDELWEHLRDLESTSIDVAERFGQEIILIERRALEFCRSEQYTQQQKSDCKQNKVASNRGNKSKQNKYTERGRAIASSTDPSKAKPSSAHTTTIEALRRSAAPIG
jgi:hypothetical protein